MPPKKGSKTFTNSDTTATDVPEMSAKVIDSASETVSPTKNPAPLPPRSKKEPLKWKPADALRSRSLEDRSKEAQKSEAQLKAEAKLRLEKDKKQKVDQAAYLTKLEEKRLKREEAKLRAEASDSSAAGRSNPDLAWSPKPKSSSYPHTQTSKKPWNNPNRRTPDQVQKAKDLEQLQEAALVSHKRKQDEAERLRIKSQNQQEREEIAKRHREREAKEQEEVAAAQGTTMATEETTAPQTTSTGAIPKTSGNTGKQKPRLPYDINDPAYHRIDPNDMEDMVSMTLHIYHGYALPLNERGPMQERDKDQQAKSQQNVYCCQRPQPQSPPRGQR